MEFFLSDGVIATFWLWMIGGAILLILEMLLPSFYLMLLGISAFVVGLATLIFPELSVINQCILFTSTSCLVFIVFLKFIKPKFKPVLEGELVGQAGILLRQSDETHGVIRLFAPVMGDDVWEVYSDEPLKINGIYQIVHTNHDNTKIKVILTD